MATDATTYYADTDSDGYGDSDDTTESCDLPEGYAEEGGDCDDSDDSISPGADEVCNEIDDDCDDEVDEDATDAFLWYVDDDGDGYGADSEVVEACDLPDGYAASDEDCDDSDIDISPDATEICDLADNDCDGETDESSGTIYYADLDGDGYGTDLLTHETCDEVPDDYVLNSDDCDDSTADVSPDAVEICDGLDNDCDGDADEEATDMTSWYFDLDGDGYGDPSEAFLACSVDGDLVANDEDCDDADATVSPDASEVCDGADNDCDGEVDEDAIDPSTFFADTDGDGYGDADSTTTACDVPDGYSDLSTDCDDSDGDVNPDATEVCNEVDDDCDGDTDEDVIETYYLDGDEDGYGDELGGTTTGCTVVDGYAEVDGDCDDADSSVHPGADEYCNGADDDCDGDIDEIGVVDGSTYYADTDGDGYGDPDSTTMGCEDEEGYVADATDCDDDDSSTYPGAEELCDEVDNDCNDLVDDGASETWYLDEDGDGFGVSTDTIETCDEPEGYALEDGDCDDEDILTNPGETEACDGVDNNCDGTADEDSEVLGQHPDCAALDCDEILAIRTEVTDGTYWFDDGVEITADECDFGSPPESVPGWSTDIRPQIMDNCVSCHTGSSAAAGLNLYSSETAPDAAYFRIRNVASTQVPSMDRIEPSSASQSYLWHKLMDTHDMVGGYGSSMPSGGFLSPDEVEMWTNWINAGAER